MEATTRRSLKCWYLHVENTILQSNILYLVFIVGLCFFPASSLSFVYAFRQSRSGGFQLFMTASTACAFNFAVIAYWVFRFRLPTAGLSVVLLPAQSTRPFFLHMSLLFMCQLSAHSLYDNEIDYMPHFWYLVLFYYPVAVIIYCVSHCCSHLSFVESQLIVASSQICLELPRLHTAIRSVDSMLDALEVLADLLGPLALVLVLTCLVGSANTVFCLVSYVRFLILHKSSDYIDYYSPPCAFISLLIWCLVLKRLVSSCVAVENKVIEFRRCLFRNIMERSNILLHDEKVQLFLKHKKCIKFTAYGCFDLDNTLIHSMVAGVCTYVVIVFQFNVKD